MQTGVRSSSQEGAIGKKWLAILASGCLLAGLLGFLVGVNRSSVTIRTCGGYVAPTQATAKCADGWSYAIPVDSIKWQGPGGLWHEGGRPDCLPPGPQEVSRITFATVDARVNGFGWRPVVWLAC